MKIEYTREIIALIREYARLFAIASATQATNDLALADRAWFNLENRLIDNTEGFR